MAEIIPFKGLRYNPSKVDIRKVTSKPYDKISPLEQEQYYVRDPFNVVRLILGKQQPSDTEENNRYTRAALFLEQWLDRKVLIREDTPAIYLYDQEFTVQGCDTPMTRRAFVALGKLVPYSDKVVFPHEKTLSGPKKDRLALTLATKTQFGQIFMLYDDPENTINTLLDTPAESEPMYSFIDKDNVSHKLYVITDEELIGKVQKSMADKQLLIADGHHRYETALNLSKEMDSQAYKYQLMSFVNINDPGLYILPTHRVVKNIDRKLLDSSWDKISDYFDKEEVSRSELTIEALRAKKNIAFGVYMGRGEYYILTLKNNDVIKTLMQKDKPKAWYELPVAVLHDAILDSMMGIDQEKLAAQTNITYVKNFSEAISLVNEGSHQRAFFITPTPIDKVCDISFCGETMPQKTTDFYPKIYRGMVFIPLFFD